MQRILVWESKTKEIPTTKQVSSEFSETHIPSLVAGVYTAIIADQATRSSLRVLKF